MVPRNIKAWIRGSPYVATDSYGQQERIFATPLKSCALEAGTWHCERIHTFGGATSGEFCSSASFQFRLPGEASVSLKER
jgi:hypothetical protein